MKRKNLEKAQIRRKKCLGDKVKKVSELSLGYLERWKVPCLIIEGLQYGFDESYSRTKPRVSEIIFCIYFKTYFKLDKVYFLIKLFVLNNYNLSKIFIFMIISEKVLKSSSIKKCMKINQSSLYQNPNMVKSRMRNVVPTFKICPRRRKNISKINKILNLC